MAGAEPLGGQVNEQQPGGSTTLCETCNYTTAAGREDGGREESNLFTSSHKLCFFLGWEFIDFSPSVPSYCLSVSFSPHL